VCVCVFVCVCLCVCVCVFVFVCVCVCACVCGMPHAMSTIRHQSVQSLAFLQAEWIPMMADCTSASSYLASLRMVFPIAARVSLNACCTDTVTALLLLVR